MHKHIIFILACVMFAGCSKERVRNKIEIDYFTEDVHTYANSHGWLCMKVATTFSAMYYEFDREGVTFSIYMSYDQGTRQVHSLWINYPEGNVACQSFKLDIVSSVEGADQILTVTHEKVHPKNVAEQVAAPDR